MQITHSGGRGNTVSGNTFEMKLSFMKNQLVFVLSLVLFPLLAFSTPGNFSGRVIDNEGKPLAAANVVLLKAGNNALVKADLTNDNGSYSFETLENGQYVLKITMTGFDPYTSDKLTIGIDNVAMPEVVLKAKSTTLKEVAVRAQNR